MICAPAERHEIITKLLALDQSTGSPEQMRLSMPCGMTKGRKNYVQYSDTIRPPYHKTSTAEIRVWVCGRQYSIREADMQKSHLGIVNR